MLRGKCHCGAVSWTFDGDPGSVTACNCTVDRRYAALWAYDFLDERIRIEGPVSSYARADVAKRHLEWLFCTTCACVVAWRGLSADADGRMRAAVNVRLADPRRSPGWRWIASMAWRASRICRTTGDASTTCGFDRTCPAKCAPLSCAAGRDGVRVRVRGAAASEARTLAGRSRPAADGERRPGGARAADADPDLRSVAGAGLRCELEELRGGEL